MPAPKGKGQPKAKKTKAKTVAASLPTPIITELPTRGRPTLYTEQAASEICHRISNGETLRGVCRSEHLPAASTVLLWVLEDREGFSERYARARELCLEAWADDVIEIGDDGTNDWMARHGEDNVAWAANGEHISRSRLRIDSRKWLLSKLRPDKYGDRVQVAGDPNAPVAHAHEVTFRVVDPSQA